jgi:hypothetical protein
MQYLLDLVREFESGGRGTQKRRDDMLQEVLDRSKRSEIKITRIAQALEADVNGPPVWHDYGVVSVGSASISLHRVLAVIPDTWQSETPIIVQCDGVPICNIISGRVYVEQPTPQIPQ